MGNRCTYCFLLVEVEERFFAGRLHQQLSLLGRLVGGGLGVVEGDVGVRIVGAQILNRFFLLLVEDVESVAALLLVLIEMRVVEL